MSTAIIVTGDRHAVWSDWCGVISREIDQLDRPEDILIHGDARGVDTIAAKLAKCTVEAFPADWSQGERAGPLRNAIMLRRLLFLRDTRGMNIHVLAFHNDIDHSRGTGDMVRRARRENVPVTVYRSDGSMDR